MNCAESALDRLPSCCGVSGFGERKTEMYGEQILDALKKFRDGARAQGVVIRRPLRRGTGNRADGAGVRRPCFRLATALELG